VTQPKHVHAQLFKVWDEMTDGFWLIHNATKPEGFTRKGNIDERGIYLTCKEREYTLAHFRKHETVTGPFRKPYDAAQWREAQKLVPVPFVGEIQDAMEGRR